MGDEQQSATDRRDGARACRAAACHRAGVCPHQQLEDAQLRRSDTSELRVDHVVAATGFRIDRIDYLDPALAKSIAREIDGIPALDSRYETSVPGLSIVGVASAPVFGPIIRFMYGAKHVAPVVARRLSSAA